MNRSILLLTAASLVVAGCGGQSYSPMRIESLTCEYRTNPLGIDNPKPRLGWVLASTMRGSRQTAYRIVVASSKEKLDAGTGYLWDTGKKSGDAAFNIPYDGALLTSNTMCWWKVQVWDENDKPTAFSQPAYWSTGLLSPDDWSASWIAMDRDDSLGSEKKEPGPQPVFFRQEFTVHKPVERAVIFSTARGIYDLYFNGKRLSDAVFAPGWTDYNVRVQYQTNDVTGKIKQGKNVLGAVVADGWYSGRIGWRTTRGYYGVRNSLLAQMEIEFADGETIVVASDGSWRVSEGPLLSADFMAGERYDARKELTGWSDTGYDDAGWEAAIVEASPKAAIVSQPSQPVRVTETVRPVSVAEQSPGVFIVDLGQNIAGFARLKVSGEAGDTVTLRFAEMLNPDGSIYTTNLRGAECTDTYTLKGGGIEVWEPRFTFHGFQYIELTGFPGTPTVDSITGCVVHSDTPQMGTFRCSDDRINRLWNNIVWGQRGNFISIPTDCPQRDERLGWMGDAQIFVRTSTYNMDVAAFFTKWAQDVEDAQSPEGAFADFSPRLENDRPFEAAPGWGDAGIIVPWTIHRVYGDIRILEDHYDAMDAWLEFIVRDNPDYLRKNHLNNNYGDWLSIEADTPKDLLATAYWAYDASLMSRIATVLGRPDDAKKYDELFANIAAAFNREYVGPEGILKGETQTAYLLSLYMDLLPVDLRDTAVKLLVEDIAAKKTHLSTGFIGVRHLNPVLCDMGYPQLAYDLLFQDTFPSWLYPVKNGATTIWERWDGWTDEKGFQDPGMNSFNHYSLGSVGEWLYGYVAGIRLDPESPAYRSMVIHPVPDRRLSFVQASYRSISGLITSEWRLDGDSIVLDITIPPSATAVVYVPAAEGSTISEGGMPVDSVPGLEPLERQPGYALYRVGSGKYSFGSTKAFME